MYIEYELITTLKLHFTQKHPVMDATKGGYNLNIMLADDTACRLEDFAFCLFKIRFKYIKICVGKFPHSENNSFSKYFPNILLYYLIILIDTNV